MFRQKPPGEGGRARPVQFSYTKTLPGQTWAAFLAGPPQWVDCHTRKDKPSKPCLTWITSGKLPCPRCTPEYVYETLGYVPLYRESDHKECVIVLRETARDLIADIEYPTLVLVSREHGPADRVTVTRHPKQKKWVTTLKERRQPADLEYSLLTMWGINELTEYMRCLPGGQICPPAKISAVDVPTESTGSVPLITDRMCGIMDEVAERARKTAELAAKNAATARGWHEPSSNGTHKPKPR
jgi:hypothetical protein